MMLDSFLWVGFCEPSIIWSWCEGLTVRAEAHFRTVISPQPPYASRENSHPQHGLSFTYYNPPIFDVNETHKDDQRFPMSGAPHCSRRSLLFGADASSVSGADSPQFVGHAHTQTQSRMQHWQLCPPNLLFLSSSTCLISTLFRQTFQLNFSFPP